MKRSIFIKIAKCAIMVPLFIFAVGYVTMLLWNWLVPALFTGPSITFWQAIGLLILSKILFSGFKGGGRCCCQRGGPHAWKDKWNNLSSEERTHLKSKFFRKCIMKNDATDSETKNI